MTASHTFLAFLMSLTVEEYWSGILRLTIWVCLVVLFSWLDWGSGFRKEDQRGHLPILLTSQLMGDV